MARNTNTAAVNIQKVGSSHEIRNLKGHYVWWEVKQLDIPKLQLEKDLAKLGYDDFVPRNDHKTALIRALRQILKADEQDRFYRRVEEGDHATFYVITPNWVYDDNGLTTDVTYEREMAVRIEKANGNLTFGETIYQKVQKTDAKGKPLFYKRGKDKGKPIWTDQKKTVKNLTWGDKSNHPLGPRIESQYREAHKFLDAQQFRTILTRIVQEHCFGVSVKSHGGVYYVPETFVDQLENLREVFSLFPDDVAMLFETPVYNDENTNRAIEWSVNNEIVDEIERLMKETTEKEKDGKLSEKILGNRREEVRNLMKKIKLYEDDLRSKANGLQEKASKLEKIFGDKQKSPKKFSLADALNQF